MNNNFVNVDFVNNMDNANNTSGTNRVDDIGNADFAPSGQRRGSSPGSPG